MTLTLLLPWFPILLAVGLGGRLLGRTRGFALGLLGALFWVALLQASGGRSLWVNPWTVATIITGTIAIVAVGGWAGDAAGELRIPQGRGGVDGATPLAPASQMLERLSHAMDEFDDWLDDHRNDPNPWPKFDEFLRGVMVRTCQATHVKPFRVLPEGQWLMPLRESDPLVEVRPVSANAGVVGDVLSSGRSWLAGTAAPASSETRDAPAWCFAVSHGNQRAGVVMVGQLGISPHEHRELLTAVERLVGQFWCTLREVVHARAAVLDDPVSGLHTREAFLRAGTESLADSYRQAEPAAVAVIALEGLRELNDVGRWDVADELLRAVGVALCQKARTDDRIGRFDGSRFILLMRRVDAELANLIVAQIVGRLKAVCGDTTRWGAVVGVRCGVAVSGGAQPDLRALVSLALAQWHRARTAGLSIALAGGAESLSDRIETKGHPSEVPNHDIPVATVGRT